MASGLPNNADAANAARIVACVNYCEGATNQELEHSSYEKTKANLMSAYSLIGQYRAQRDALVKAALKAQNALKLTAMIDRTSTSDDAANALTEALSTVKRHNHEPDPMMQQRDELLAAIGKLKPGYSAEEFAELAAVYQKVKGGAL